MIDHTTCNPEFLKTVIDNKNLIEFFVRNNLIHFPISRIDEIQGDHFDWIAQLKTHLTYRRDYNDKGLMVFYNDPVDNVDVTYEYDDHDRVVKSIVKSDNSSRIFECEYNDIGNVVYTSVSDVEDGDVQDHYETWIEYDSDNHIISTRTNTGQYLSLEYDDRGNCIKEHDLINDRIDTWTYDEHNRISSFTSFFGHTVLYDYDRNGNVIRTARDDGSYISIFESEYYDSGQIKRYGGMILPDLSL